MHVSEIKSILSRLGLAPSKTRGQNFLIESGSIDRILLFANIAPGNSVIEVGPGLGALTRELLNLGHRVTALEIDRGFSQYLTDFFKDEPFFTLMHADALTVDLSSLAGEKTDTYDRSRLPFLISNVPYSISTQLLLWALQQRGNISAACFLLQREFAERVAAQPNSKSYGSLSVLCQMYLGLELGPIISGNCFYPPTKVESRLLRITPFETPIVEVSDPIAFESFVRSLFQQRRKTLLNNLIKTLPTGDRQTAEHLCSSSGLDPKARSETIPLHKFVDLFEAWRQLTAGCDSFERGR